MTDTGPVRHAGCDVAVVIPAFKQPGFLPEALESVLGQKTGGQQTGLRLSAVVVDDGCPFPATREVGLAYARRHPGRVHYLRRRNGGLSAARNTGIDFALAAWPGCRAIYMLDADNRLAPPFIQRAWELLQGSGPETGWVYPDIDMFGFAENYSVRGPYSRILHLLENYCEAGSLVRREVFEAGIRFDEEMRQGFEDWDFWLQCAGRGFRGVHLPQSGFRYRRRAESMLTDSERAREAILLYMRRKHRAQFGTRALLALEAEEAPRFAIWCTDTPGVRLSVDPAAGRGEEVTQEEARRRFVEAKVNPRAQHFPQVMVFAARDALHALEEARVLRNVFWLAHLLLRDAHVLPVAIEFGDDQEIAVEAVTEGVTGAAGAPLVMVRTAVAMEVASDPNPDWFESFIGAHPQPRLAMIRVRLPRLGATVRPTRSVARQVLLEVSQLAAMVQNRSLMPADWRADARRLRGNVDEVYGLLAQCGAVLPHLPRPGERHIGFILPLFDFGGVEKVVLNYAATMRARGWIPHLFVTGAGKVHVGEGFCATFETVNFVRGTGEEEANWDHLFFGSGTSGFATRGEARDTLGLLATMDVVLNSHSLAGHALAARLRRLGVRTYLGLHLVERSRYGNPIGNPHLGLAYEHAYNGFVVISDQLRAWCAGQAVPEAKLHLVRNAPSYPTAPGRVAQALAARRARPAGAPLKVLYLGRLDMQKGLDRLREMILRTAGPDIVWRVVGRPILGDAEGEALADSGVAVEPPVAQGRQLDALYAWADVVVLPSRFEGVPLTILEAQRMGCAVVATDVGAVAEIVQHGTDGLLVRGGAEEDAILDGLVAALRRLAADPDLLLSLGKAAAARIARSGWEVNMAGWIAHLEAELAPPAAAVA
jgi:glycosyltransferase involved in cell wall biosynthesis